MLGKKEAPIVQPVMAAILKKKKKKKKIKKETQVYELRMLPIQFPKPDRTDSMHIMEPFNLERFEAFNRSDNAKDGCMLACRTLDCQHSTHQLFY